MQRIRESDEGIRAVRTAGHSQQILPAPHLQLHVKLSLEQLFYLCRSPPLPPSGEEDLAGIIGVKERMVIHTVCAVAEDFPLFQIFCTPVKFSKSLCPCIEKIFALLLQQTRAAIQRGHQRVRRRAGLKYIQLSLHLRCRHDLIHPPSAHMKQRCLRQTGQGLVGALDHQICPAGHRSLSKEISAKGKSQVGAVGLIHHQGRGLWPVMAVRCDLPDVRQYPIVGRAGQNHGPGIGISVQELLYLFRRYASIHPKAFIHRRCDPVHLEIPQLDGVIDRLMTVAGHDHFAVSGRCRPHRCQIAAGAAAHQVPGSVRTAQGGGALHGLFQDALRIVEIIGALDFRNVPGNRQIRHRSNVPLMARHVEGILVLIHQFLQLRPKDGIIDTGLAGFCIYHYCLSKPFLNHLCAFS